MELDMDNDLDMELVTSVAGTRVFLYGWNDMAP